MEHQLPSQYQEFIHISRYARWRDDLRRRETWHETVMRWSEFWLKQLRERFADKIREEEASALVKMLGEAVVKLDVMPSMRGLMTAGKALERDHAAGYNCSYVAIDDPIAFAEVLYLLACGCGVGFSVERQSIKQMPTIAETFHDSETIIPVPDSKQGWAKSFRELLALLYVGQVPKWDVSQVRPKGARLKTFGGRASGPDPLVDLFKFTIAMFKNAAGRKLTSIECHDLVCKIGEVIVVGGVRRSALISLSNLSDDRMRNAKNGDWRQFAKHRQLANNSAAYTERPDFEVFLKEIVTLYESKSGERGIFSRVAAQQKASENGRRKLTDEDGEAYEFGTNPCGEIILRSMGFCNLSEVVLRPSDTIERVTEKVKLATIIGTLQSTLTNFRFLRKAWKTNAEEERLLGVSLTGILDHPELGEPACARTLLPELRKVAIETNAKYADMLGIARSAAITTVKPSGTVSQLVNSSSGIHPRYSRYYIRRVQQDNKDPVTTLLKEAGVPNEIVSYNSSQSVFEFPMQSPPEARLRDHVSALRQLELYQTYRDHWCEHNPSTTIYYRDGDFLDVAQWVWKNFEKVGGVSFLPASDHAYAQAPYEEISAEEYERRLSKMPKIDWERLRELEKEDQTTPHAEPACAGGACEINI